MDHKKGIQWKSHPLVDEFPKSLLAVFLVLFFSAGAIFVFQNMLFGLISFFILTVAMMPYFFPSYYRIDENEISIRFLIHNSKRKLSLFRNFYVNPKGVHFSTFRKPSPLDPFRGTYIRFGKHKDTVLPFVRQLMEKKISVNAEDEENDKT